MDDHHKKLNDIFGKVSHIDASYEVRATAKHYPQFTKVFVPYTPYRKTDPFMEEVVEGEDGAEDCSSRTTASVKTSIEDNFERSLRKTKTLIADYSLCNEFDLFCTFTFKKDRQDVDKCKEKMNNWLKNQQKRNGKFKYLIVPEFHKDGKSLHFHALFKDYTGERIDTGRNHKGRTLYHFKSYTLGFNSAVEIDNPQKVSNYIRKYITKDMPQFHGKHRFWATTGLKRPKVEDNPSDWYLHETPLQTYAGEYGLTLYFPVRKEEG